MEGHPLLCLVFCLMNLDLCITSSETTSTKALKAPELHVSSRSCYSTDVTASRTDCFKTGQKLVTHGQTCNLIDSHTNVTSAITCWNGNWIAVSGVRLKRQTGQANQNGQAGPRQPGDLMLQATEVGAGFGSAFGPIGTAVGAVIGAVVGLICEIFCHHSDPPPPNRPPTISWSVPQTNVYYAQSGKTSAVVTWPTPSATDPEDGKVEATRVTGLTSGSDFSRGSHTITYQAKDSGQLVDFKYYSFSVKVHTCKTPLKWPSNGFVQCGNSERIAGSDCTYSCFKGYRLDGNANRRCGTDGVFSGNDSHCEAVTCSNASPSIKPSHGKASCTDSVFEYNTVCATRCDKGFSLSSDSFQMTKCSSTGAWSTTLPPCQDAEPPEIIDCPTSNNIYADRGQSFATVTWNVPRAHDNSGGNVTVTQTIGKASGSQFDVGIHEIRYLATDGTGNKSPECIFFVIVEKLLCDPPVIVDPYMKLTCPDGFIYGSSCTLSCRGSYPLMGNNKMYCDRNSTNGKPTYWNWGNGAKPYCKQNNCPTLTAPAHGALTCDKWAYGRQCMLHCNDHYDIPAAAGGGSVARFTGQFTCSTSSGKWSPVESVPGCSVRRDPSNFVLPGEVYYYSGSCSDITTQDTIKAHFIQEMQTLQSDPGWQGICPNPHDCNVQNVDISCGTTRKRRGTLFNRRRRQTQQASILLSFDINLKWKTLGNSSLDTYNRFDTLAKGLGSIIENTARSGSLNVSLSSLDTDSLQFGQLGIRCEPGRYPRPTTLSCASCPLGSTYDSTFRKCVLCPKGKFRDDEDNVTCSSCPVGMSTPSNGTDNSTECRPICKEGYYSLDGIEPCTPCSRLEYGPSTLATKCEKCERGMMTNSSGSTQASDCKSFDVAIRGGTHLATAGSVLSDIVSFTLASWVKVSNFDDNSLQLSVKKGAQEILVDIGQSVNITLHSLSKSSGVPIKKGVWQHLTVVWDASSTTLKLFVQGKELFTSQLTTATAGIAAPSGSDLSLSFKGPTSSAGLISGLLLKTSVLTDNTIKTLASTCYSSETGAFDMAHFLQTHVEGLEPVTPSTCDAKDDCMPNPCNGHRCVDGLNTFTCQCSDGYTGNTCQIPPDYCKNHKCEHGATCHNLLTNYTCSCMAGFKGQFCESKIVDGGYGPWGDWSICSKSCEKGQMVRTRVCDSPAPDPDGKPCIGQANETEACNVQPCPVCPHPPRSYGTRMACNRSDDLISCSVSCRDGMWFTPGFTPLEEYKCGKETAYQWNGKPPSCSDVHSPEMLETSTTIQYSSATPCHEPETFKNTLMKKSKETLQCSHNQTCAIDVTIEGCSGDRSKRSLSGVKAVITLRVPLVKGNNLDMENFAKTNAMSPAMLKLLQSVSDLETSVRQLNSTRDILTFNVDGNVYDVLTIVTTSSVRCDKGKVRLEALCVDCPQGTFSSDQGSCLPCQYGTYQDLTGSVTCKKCPKGVSTEFIGSISEADCSVAVPIEDGVNSDDDDSSDSVGIIIGCTVAAVVLCGVVLGIGIRYHLRSKAKKTKMGSFASMNMVHSERPPINTFLT